MKSALFFDLLRFSLAKKTAQERLRYVVRSLVFYILLARAISAGERGCESISSSQTGDDIYPLF